MAAIGWILIGGFIALVLLLLAKDEYHDKIEKKRRMELRAEIQWPAAITIDQETVDAKTVNISAGGALLCCPREFSLHQIVRLALRPPMRAPLEITAEIVRIDINCADDSGGAYGSAVRFIIISEKDRQFISFSVFDHHREKNLASQSHVRFKRV